MKQGLALLAALAVLWLFGACGLAEDAPIASYEMPAGGQMSHISEAESLLPPAGLEAMYQALCEGDPWSDLYLVRMPHGRALVSVSCQKARCDLTAEELLALWPRIEQNLSETALSVAGEEAQVRQMYGYPMLDVQVGLMLEGGLGVDAEGFAFCRDGEIREVWALSPSPDLYAPGSAEAEELAADTESLRWFLERLSFPLEASEETYTHRTGLFSVTLPESIVLLAPDASEEERASMRKAYEEANPEGASAVFDSLLKDQRENGAWLVFTPDLRGVASVAAVSTGGQRLDFDTLLRQAEPIRATLEQTFGLAVCLEDGGSETFSGLEHAWLSYWVRCEQMNVLLDVFACETDAWLYEVDLYAADGDLDARDMLWSFLSSGLSYHPPVNALE